MICPVCMIDSMEEHSEPHKSGGKMIYFKCRKCEYRVDWGIYNKFKIKSKELKPPR